MGCNGLNMKHSFIAPSIDQPWCLEESVKRSVPVVDISAVPHHSRISKNEKKKTNLEDVLYKDKASLYQDK